ncbi:MAG: hypothetical protein ACR2G0_01435 [Chthoniobacterales bacterium]
METGKLTPILGLIAGMAFASAVAAQGPEGGPPPFHHRPNLSGMLTNTLNLSDAQKAQVDALVKTVQPQLDAIHEQARVAADAVVKQLDIQIRPFSSADQQKRLDALETLRATAPSHEPK